MLSYHDCLVSADGMIMGLALSNSCYLFRKYSYSGELDLRQLHIECLKSSQCYNIIINMKEGGFSIFDLANISHYDVTLYAGLRALQLNE